MRTDAAGLKWQCRLNSLEYGRVEGGVLPGLIRAGPDPDLSSTEALEVE